MADTPETPDETTPDAEPEAPVTPEDADGGVEEGAVPGSPASPEEVAPPEDPPPAAEAPPQAPKERKAARRSRSRGSSGAATPKTPKERQAERDRLRKVKAEARRRRRPRERARAKARRTGPGEGTPPREHGEGRPKVRQGIVTSDKADKTITVRIDAARRHMRYEKIVRSSTKLHAHDEANDAHEGDVVRVVETRPLSATKRWRLLEVLERAR
jgi:small subunit ribosomal protein S17